MNNIVFVNFECNESTKVVAQKIWQYDYGQILRIQGLNLPAAVEIHFSLQKTGGIAERRIGVTKDGVTDVVIPDFVLKGEGIERNYSAYAFIYLSDEESGRTEHRIELNITSRPEPEGSTSSNDTTSFGAIMDAVNKIAEQNGQGVSDEKIQEAVNAYMEANPVEGNVTVDTELSETSTNPVANSTVTKKFSQLSATIANKATVENRVVKFYKAATTESETETELFSVDLSSIGGTDGLNLENLTLSVSQVGDYQRLSMSDGTTTKTVDIPITAITDKQVQTAVDTWLGEHPDAITVNDGTVTQEKLSDELVEKLGLEANHHLTEVKLTLHKAKYNSFWAGEDTGNCTSTELFETPQYIRIVNNHTCDISGAGVRFADINDYENATFVAESLGYYHQNGYFADTIPVGEELTIPTFEWGSNSRKYMQIKYQPSDWSNAWNNIEIYAIYDTWKPTYDIPNDANSKEIFLEDLPMKWVATSRTGGDRCGVFCAVPYYPDFTYHIRGGYYANVNFYSLNISGIYDDISVFDVLQPCIIGMSGNISNINAFNISKTFGSTTQYDTSVNGGADTNYQWAYFKTPTEDEHTGLKWLLIQFNLLYDADNNTYTGSTLTEEVVEYALEQWLSKNVQYQYISRWQNKDMPRKPTTQLRILNPNLNDGGSIYQAFNTLNVHSPLVNAKWVLFGDSLTDSYGGHDKSSNYFAAKIANEFDMDFDNRAKSGSNIYAGGSGNYTSVSGIIKLDEYLAEIEAGTTEQADYITVAFGTNTFLAQMGTNEDTSETNTSVYGATKYFIEKIREKVPNAVLGFVLSPRQDWGSNDPDSTRDLDGAREAIRTVCEDYGVPYIDMSTQSGITVDMLPDGIHISNDQSQKLYYHAMRRFMMGL